MRRGKILVESQIGEAPVLHFQANINMVGALIFSVLGYLYEKDHTRKIPDLIIHRQESDIAEKMLQVGPDLEKKRGD